MKIIKFAVVLFAIILLTGCSKIGVLSIEVNNAPVIDTVIITFDYDFNLKNEQEIALIGASENSIYYLKNDHIKK